MFSRSKELIGLIGETTLHFQVPYKLYINYLGLTNLQSAGEAAEQYLKAVPSSQDGFPMMLAHRGMGMGMGLMFQGESVQAQEKLRQDFSRCNIKKHRTLALNYA